jgi:uncharacterized protein YpmB
MTNKSKVFISELEKSNGEDYPTFTLTKEIIDRDGDLIKVDGIDLSIFKKNPVMLFGHNQSAPAIGVWKDIKKEDNMIVAKPVFNTGVGYELADIVSKLVASGRIKACSVSISPDWNTMENVPTTDKKKAHRVVNKSVLNEVSIVNIPANQMALAKAFEDGVITKEELDIINIEEETFEEYVEKIVKEYEDSFDKYLGELLKEI